MPSTNAAPTKGAELKKQIEAMVASSRILDPNVAERLSVEAVYHYLRLPDSSFGWSAEGPMPVESKYVCAILALRLGLEPGMGLVTWLGARPYIETAGLRMVAQNHGEFRWTGSREIRPLTSDEKELLDVQDGDRALVLEQEATVKGEAMRLRGYGLLEKWELCQRGRNGKPLPGRGSKKDIYQTLVTRAERDIFKHYLPLYGAQIAPEPEERAQMLELQKSGPSSYTTSPADMAAQDADARRRDTLVKAYDTRVSILLNNGATEEELEKLLGVDSLLEPDKCPLDDLQAHLETLDDYTPANEIKAQRSGSSTRKRKAEYVNGKAAAQKAEATAH